MSMTKVALSDVEFVVLDGSVSMYNDFGKLMFRGDGHLCGAGITGWWYATGSGGNGSGTSSQGNLGLRMGAYTCWGWDSSEREY